MADVKISELTPLTAGGISDSDDIRFVVDDLQSTPATKQLSLTAVQTYLNFGTVVATAANGDSTPSVSGVDVLKTANTSGTQISSFDNGVNGQSLTLVIQDEYTNVSHAAGNIYLAAQYTHYGHAGNCLRFIHDGTNWREVMLSNVIFWSALDLPSPTSPPGFYGVVGGDDRGLYICNGTHRILIVEFP